MPMAPVTTTGSALPATSVCATEAVTVMNVTVARCAADSAPPESGIITPVAST